MQMSHELLMCMSIQMQMAPCEWSRLLYEICTYAHVHMFMYLCTYIQYIFAYMYLRICKLRNANVVTSTSIPQDIHMWAAHGGDQTSNIWTSRSIGFHDKSCECLEFQLLAFHEKYICGCLDSLTNMQMAQHERGHEHECSTRHTYVQFVTDHSEGVPMCVHNSVAPPKAFSRDVPHIESRIY